LSAAVNTRAGAQTYGVKADRAPKNFALDATISAVSMCIRKVEGHFTAKIAETSDAWAGNIL
jgi:hypothetical protein